MCWIGPKPLSLCTGTLFPPGISGSTSAGLRHPLTFGQWRPSEATCWEVKGHHSLSGGATAGLRIVFHNKGAVIPEVTEKMEGTLFCFQLKDPNKDFTVLKPEKQFLQTCPLVAMVPRLLHHVTTECWEGVPCSVSVESLGPHQSASTFLNSWQRAWSLSAADGVASGVHAKLPLFRLHPLQCHKRVLGAKVEFRLLWTEWVVFHVVLNKICTVAFSTFNQ